MTSPSTTIAKSPSGLVGNSGIAMFAKIFYLASRLLVPPMVLAHISMVEYGLWSACFILIMYIGLADAGFSTVYVRYIAQFNNEGRLVDINRLMSTGVIALSILAVLVLSILWLNLHHIFDFLKVNPDQHEKAKILVMGSASMFLLDLTLGAYCYLLHGLQRIREEQKIAIIGYALEPLLILVFLQIGLGVYSLLVAFVLRYLWSLTSFIHLAHHFLPGLSLRIRDFSPNMLRLFIGYGSAVQLSTLIGTALFTLDRLIAGFLLGPKGIALFEIGTKLPVAAISVPAAISNVAMPAAAHHYARNDLMAVHRIYHQSTRAISLLAALPLGFFAVFGHPIIWGWLGPNESLEQLSLILTLTAVWSHLHIITGPGTAVLRAMGLVSYEFIYHGLRILGLTLGIILSIFVFENQVTALVVGVSGGNAFAAITFMIYIQRKFGYASWDLMREILLPGFLVYPVAICVLLVTNHFLPFGTERWQILASLLVSGLAYCALCTAIAWQWVLHADEKNRLLEGSQRLHHLVQKWKKK